jgi:hypothetical protein
MVSLITRAKIVRAHFRARRIHVVALAVIQLIKLTLTEIKSWISMETQFLLPVPYLEILPTAPATVPALQFPIRVMTLDIPHGSHGISVNHLLRLKSMIILAMGPRK